MSVSLFGSEWWAELAIQVLVAVLTTLLGMLTYDRKVVQPRMRSLRMRMERHLDRPI